MWRKPSLHLTTTRDSVTGESRDLSPGVLSDTLARSYNPSVNSRHTCSRLASRTRGLHAQNADDRANWEDPAAIRKFASRARHRRPEWRSVDGLFQKDAESVPISRSAARRPLISGSAMAIATSHVNCSDPIAKTLQRLASPSSKGSRSFTGARPAVRALWGAFAVTVVALARRCQTRLLEIVEKVDVDALHRRCGRGRLLHVC